LTQRDPGWGREIPTAAFSSPAAKRGGNAAGSKVVASHLLLLIRHGSSLSPASSTPASCGGGGLWRIERRRAWCSHGHASKPPTARGNQLPSSVARREALHRCRASSVERWDHLHTGVFADVRGELAGGSLTSWGKLNCQLPVGFLRLTSWPTEVRSHLDQSCMQSDHSAARGE
jgi:hypothetical protein